MFKKGVTGLLLVLMSVSVYTQIRISKEGSTIDGKVTSGDTISWVIQIENLTDNILDGLKIQDILSGDHSYVEESFILPPGFSIDSNFISGTINSSTDYFAGTGFVERPAINASIKPNISSSGDGYQPLFYKDNIYFVNHHGGGDVLTCYDLSLELNCPGYPRNLPAGNSTSRTDAIVDATKIVNGVLYYPVYKDFVEWGLGCLDLETNKECGHGYIKMGPDVNKPAIDFPPSYRIPISGPWQVGDELYVMDWQMQLHGYNIKTETLVAGSPFDLSAVFSGLKTRELSSGIVGEVVGDVIYLRVSYYGSTNTKNWTGHYISAFDTKIKGIAAGWPQNEAVMAHSDGGAGHEPTVFLRYNTNGNPDAVCTSASRTDGSGVTHNCFDLTNGDFIPNALPPSFPTIVGEFGTEVYLNNVSYFPRWIHEECYAWDWSKNELIKVFNGPQASHQNYGLAIDDDGCIWAGGHSNLVWNFAPESGGSCIVVSSEGSVAPLDYYCASKPETTWDQLTVNNLDTTEFERFNVIIIGDDDSTVLDTFELYSGVSVDTIFDLSIPPFTNHQKLSYEISALASKETILDTPVVVFKFSGPPVEICLQTVVSDTIEGKCDGSVQIKNTANAIANDSAFSDSTEYSIIVLPDETCVVVGEDTSISRCVSDTSFVQLDSLLKDDNPITQGGEWYTFGDAVFDTATSILDLFNSPTGTHTFYYKVTQQDTIDSATVTVHISKMSATKSYTAPLCFGASNAAINILVENGIPKYSYSWYPEQADTNELSGLAAGIYNVTIADSIGCIYEDSIEVKEPDSLNALITSLKHINCFGDNTGEAAVNVTGGTLPYHYKWNNNDTTQNVNGLAAGTITVIVTDANNCVDSAAAILNQPALQFQINEITSDTVCQSDGKLIPSVSGGTVPYSFQWDNQKTDSVNTNLGVGNYQLVVTDSAGCKDSLIGVVHPATIIDYELLKTSPLCYGDSNGKAEIVLNKIDEPYTIEWSKRSNSLIETNLEAGIHYVIITDAHGCYDSIAFKIEQPDTLVIRVEQTKANINCKPPNGAGKVTIIGGTPDYLSSWGTFEKINTGAGVYPLIITDANGCVAEDTLVIDFILPPSIDTTNLTLVHPDCKKTGSIKGIEVDAASEVQYTWYKDGELYEGDVQSISDAGEYTLIVTDTNGCSDTISGITIKEYELPVALFEATPDTGEAPLIVEFINLSTGKEELTYEWDFDDGEFSSEKHPIHEYDYDGNKKVFYPSLIVYDSNGCHSLAHDSIAIRIRPVIEFPNVFTPNTFTPNGDGVNDHYMIREKWIKQIDFTVYNRWGVKLFYSNQANLTWDGKNFNGQDVAQGTYYFILKYQTIDDSKWIEKTGNITLIRNQ